MTRDRYQIAIGQAVIAAVRATMAEEEIDIAIAGLRRASREASCATVLADAATASLRKAYEDEHGEPIPAEWLEEEQA